MLSGAPGKGECSIVSEKFLGISAVGMELSELLHYAWTVGGISHSKPLAVGIEHLDGGLA